MSYKWVGVGADLFLVVLSDAFVAVDFAEVAFHCEHCDVGIV